MRWHKDGKPERDGTIIHPIPKHGKILISNALDLLKILDMYFLD